MSLKDLKNITYSKKAIELKNIFLDIEGVKALTDVTFDCGIIEFFEFRDEKREK